MKNIVSMVLMLIIGIQISGMEQTPDLYQINFNQVIAPSPFFPGHMYQAPTVDGQSIYRTTINLCAVAFANNPHYAYACKFNSRTEQIEAEWLGKNAEQLYIIMATKYREKIAYQNSIKNCSIL